MSVFLLLLSAFACVWGSEFPKISESRIDGLRVVTVDTGRGEGFTAGVYVPNGTHHDNPVGRAGISHLLEHLVFLESEGRSQPEWFLGTASTVGGAANAYTAGDRTFYHISGHREALAEAVEDLGRLTTRPVFRSDAFARERTVVMNEVASYQGQDFRNLTDATWMALLRPDHHLSRFAIGTQEGLGALTMNDAMDVFFSAYNYDSMVLIVVGNLSGNTAGEKLRAGIQAGFRPPSDPRPHREIRIQQRLQARNDPSPVASLRDPHLRQVEIVSNPEAQFGRVLLTFDLGRWRDIMTGSLHEASAFYVLSRALASDLPGSPFRTLREEGLLNAGYAMCSTSDLFPAFQIYLDIPKEKLSARREITNRVLSYVAGLQTYGLSPELQRFLQSQIRSQIQRAQRSNNQLLDMTIEWLNGTDPHPNQQLDPSFWDQVFSETNLSAAAQKLDFNRLLVSYMGPDVRSEQRLPVLNRAFQVAPLEESWIRPAPRPVEAKPLPRPEGLIATTPLPLDSSLVSWPHPVFQSPALQVAAHVDPTESEVSLVVRLTPSHFNDPSRVVLAGPFAQGFARHFAPIEAAAENLGLRYSISERLSSGAFEFHLQGPPEWMESWFRLVLEAWLRYRPERAEWQQLIQDSLSNRVNHHQSLFSGEQARAFIGSLQEGRPTVSENIQLLQQWLRTGGAPTSPGERWDIHMAGAGPMHPDSVRDLGLWLRAQIPEPLLPSERRALRSPRSLPRGFTILHGSLSPRMGPDDVGAARALAVGPTLDVDYLHLRGTSKWLSQRVFRLNRTERSLGYIHGANHETIQGQAWLHLFGETNGPGRGPEIARGWDEIFEDLSRGIPASELSNHVLGSSRADRLSNETAAQKARSMMVSLIEDGDPYWLTLIREESRSVTGESASKWLRTFPFAARPGFEVTLRGAQPAAAEAATCGSLFEM